jgi:hypothetical protein
VLRVFCWEIDIFAVQWWPNAFVDFLHVLHRNRVDRNRLVLLPNVRLHSTHKKTFTSYQLRSTLIIAFDHCIWKSGQPDFFNPEILFITH